jgi:glutaminase
VLAIEQDAQRSINPLVNAGAIAAVSLIEPAEVEARWTLLRGFLSKLAGEVLSVMDDVLESVSTTNHRNRAIANLLYSYDRLYCEPNAALEVYNRQSCVAVTTEQLAWMGASLANGGMHPRTGVRAFDEEYADEILSLMCLSGFYDESGTWAYRVGLPAKSGVGGASLRSFRAAWRSPPFRRN